MRELQSSETRARRVVVAMSGGVDSSVAAALLLEQGYDVIGVTMRLWSGDSDGAESGCCSLSAVEDARRVADRLGIPYYVADFEQAFAEKVIGDFTREYVRGRTPNPCLRCNQHIKFNAFLHYARQLGAGYLATGHYARVGRDEATGRYVLRRGQDHAKDQSYALCLLTQDQLSASLFPVGELSKPQTRALAARLGLRVADKPDSQEICFIPNNDYGDFLRRHAPETAAPGPIVDRSGKVLGQHPGISFFTIGQKRGLRLPLPHPMFVVSIHPESNTLVVGTEADLRERSCLVTDISWIAIPRLEESLPVMAKVRYNMPEQPAVIHPLEDGRVHLEFVEPQRAITPGQAAVFYRGEEVLGGGIVAGTCLAATPNG